VHYGDLKNFFSEFNRPVVGTYMEGEDVHQFQLQGPSILLFGSESHGIDPKLESVIDHKLTIPRIGQAESLNVALSCAVVLDNLIRNISE